MSHEAKNKLVKYSIATLVAYYEDFSVTAGELFLEFFIFRIGYAVFFLMMMEGLDEYIVLDFDLQDGDSTHHDRSPVAALPPLPTPMPPEPPAGAFRIVTSGVSSRSIPAACRWTGERS